MDSVKLINFMEELRYQRKLTQEEYLDGVISQRQFYRYRKGESEIPFEVIDKLIEKIGIPYVKLISQFIEQSKTQKELVLSYFNLVINKKAEEAEEIFVLINNLKLIDKESTTIVKMGRIISSFNKGYFSNLELCIQLKENMNFNEMIKKETLHDFEIYLLGLIMEYSEPDRLKTLEKVMQLLKTDRILIGHNKILLMQVFFWIIKFLGREKRYHEVILFSDLAIVESHKNHTNYCLNYFHYYKSLAHLRLGQTEEYEKNLYKAIVICIYQSGDNNSKFINTIYKDTGVDAISFIKSKL